MTTYASIGLTAESLDVVFVGSLLLGAGGGGAGARNAGKSQDMFE